MQDPLYQQTDLRDSVVYRLLVPACFSRCIADSPIGFVAAATGIGLLVGIGLTCTAHYINAVIPPKVSQTLASHAFGAITVPAVYATTTTSSPSNQVETQKKPAAAAPVLSPVSQQSSKATPVHKKSGIHKLWNWTRGSSKNKGPRRKPYVSPNPTAPIDRPTALELAAAAAAQGPFYVRIEGDATVASYDEAMGAIGTYEGSSFVLDKTGSESGVIPWDDYPFNVHYRCDGSGSCTLVHRGATASAKMIR